MVVSEKTRHGLEEGDHVQVTEVKGMVEVNGRAFKVIKVISPFAFSIDCDTTQYKPYSIGGIITLIKILNNNIKI